MLKMILIVLNFVSAAQAYEVVKCKGLNPEMPFVKSRERGDSIAYSMDLVALENMSYMYKGRLIIPSNFFMEDFGKSISRFSKDMNCILDEGLLMCPDGDEHDFREPPFKKKPRFFYKISFEKKGTERARLKSCILHPELYKNNRILEEVTFGKNKEICKRLKNQYLVFPRLLKTYYPSLKLDMRKGKDLKKCDTCKFWHFKMEKLIVTSKRAFFGKTHASDYCILDKPLDELHEFSEVLEKDQPN